MMRRSRISVLVVAVALGSLPLLLGAAPAAATTASVSTVDEFWDAWTDDAVTQIDLENDIDLITYNGSDYTSCGVDGGSYPERDSPNAILVDGHGFTLTMTCDNNAVLYSFGSANTTVRDITITHLADLSDTTPAASGNGIVIDGSGDVIVESSTIIGNWAAPEDVCEVALDVSVAWLCAPVGGGIATRGDVFVTDSTIQNNRAEGIGGGIYAGGVVTITDSIVADNKAVEAEDDFNLGGGIAAYGGAVVDGVTFAGNVVGCEGGCGAFGGAIAGNGVDVANSTFVDNLSGCIGECGNVGGAIYGTGVVTIVGSTFTDNEATCENACNAQGGAVYASGFDATLTGAGAAAWGGDVGAADVTPGAVTVATSTFTGNLATVDPGNDACNCEGGAIIALGETSVEIVASTFTGNEALFEGGAVGVGSGEAASSPLAITNSTVTDNTSGYGAIASEDDITLAYDTITDNALFELGPVSVSSAYGDGDLTVGEARVQGPSVGAAVTLNTDLTSFATVITGSAGGPNCLVGGSTDTDGYNFADDTSCGFTDTANGDSEAPGNDPMLGGLAANGGPTETQLPAATSPLLDRIPMAACQTGPAAGVTTDQRGVTRPQGIGCDIGAVEVEVAVALEPNFTG